MGTIHFGDLPLPFAPQLEMIAKWTGHPCATPNPMVFIETLGKALPPVLYNLSGFSAWDIAAGAVRKAGGARKLFGRGGGRQPGYTDAKGTEEPQGFTRGEGGSLRNVRGSGGKHGRGVTGSATGRIFPTTLGPQTFAYELAGLAAGGLYLVMLASLYKDFLMRWQSAIYEVEGCPLVHNCYGTLYATPFIGGGPASAAALWLGAVTGAGFNMGGRDIAIDADAGAGISYSLTIEGYPVPDDVPTLSTYLYDFTAGESGSVSVGARNPPAHGRTYGGTMQKPTRTPSLHLYQVIIENKDPKDFRVTGGQVHVSSGRCAGLVPGVPHVLRSFVTGPV